MGTPYIPPRLLTGAPGMFGVNVVLFLTGRPSALATPTITICRLDSNTSRPVALWLNLPPGFASSALANSSGATGTVGQNPAAGAVDTVIHYLFRGLAWSKSLQSVYASSPGTSVVTSSGSASATTWTSRALLAVFTPKVVAAVAQHFGQPVGYLELEARNYICDK